MTRFLSWVLIAALGGFTIGCEGQKDTTENKAETKTTETKDGKTTGETTTVDTKSKAATSDNGGAKTEKTTEKTTETNK
jgi:hypothetical protein